MSNCRLENTLSYGLERVWAFGFMKESNRYNWVSSSFIWLFPYRFEDCWYAQMHTKKQIVFLTIPSCYHFFSQQGCDRLWQRNHYDKSSQFSQWGFHGHPGWGGREEGMLICTTNCITIMYHGVSWLNNSLSLSRR